jgi:ATP-binding cassette subfamily A (ABC1) protein 3
MTTSACDVVSVSRSHAFSLCCLLNSAVFLKVAQDDEEASLSPPPSGVNYLSPSAEAGRGGFAGGASEKMSLLGGPSTASMAVSSAAHDAQQHAAMMATLQANTNDITTLRQFQALLKKRASISRRDKKAMVCQIILPVLLLIIGLASLSSQTTSDWSSLVLNMSGQYDSPNLVYTVPSLNTFLAESLATHPDDAVNQTLPVSTLHDMEAQMLARRGDERTSHYGAYYGDDASDTSTYTTLVNITALFGQPTFVNEGNTAILRGVTKVPSAGITMSFVPFALTETEKSGRNDANGLFSSIIVTLAFSFIPASFCVFVVMEREQNSKHLQMISGVGVISYWLSSFIFDLFMYCIPAAICALVLIGNGNPNFTGENLPVVALSLVLYGTSVIPFTYLCSFLFKSHLTAQNVMVLVYLIGGMGLTMVGFALYIIVPDTGKILRHFFRLLPNFCLGDTLFYLSVRHTGHFNVSQWDLDISGFDLLYMFIETIVYFCAVLLVEYCQSRPELVDMCKRRDPLVPSSSQSSDSHDGAALTEEDSDVAAERAWMQDPNASNPALIQLHGLRKTFPMARSKVNKKDKVAVENLYFSVKAGECFGFLGQNGAGQFESNQHSLSHAHPQQCVTRIPCLALTRSLWICFFLVVVCRQDHDIEDSDW